MVKVIPDEPVCNRCLRRDCLYGRVGSRQGRRGIETRIGYAVNTNLAVVRRDVFKEPFYGIVCVTAFIRVFFTLFVLYIGSDIHEVPFAHPTSSYILIDKNISRLYKQHRRNQPPGIFIFAVRAK